MAEMRRAVSDHTQVIVAGHICLYITHVGELSLQSLHSESPRQFQGEGVKKKGS